MAEANELEIRNSRLIGFPVEAVYRAFADPQLLKDWWGPHGFTNTIHQFDLREGGTWRLTMHGPEKGNYENESEFTLVVPNRKIAWKRRSKPLFGMELIFEPVSERQTVFSFRMIFDSPEECGKIRKYAPDKNEENFDRLESLLRKLA